jgi:hypothetical protein
MVAGIVTKAPAIAANCKGSPKNKYPFDMLKKNSIYLYGAAADASIRRNARIRQKSRRFAQHPRHNNGQQSLRSIGFHIVDAGKNENIAVANDV